MKDVKLCSDFKDSFKGGNMDFQIKDYNRTKTIDLMPQSRRPKAISKAYAHLVEQGLEPELPKKK